MSSPFLEVLGGEDGCERLSAAFYARVAEDPVLRRLFPFKSLRCATREFAAFLVQFLGGDEERTQHRWWLSLRESHARFRIGEAERAAWLGHMNAALDSMPLSAEARQALRDFFEHASGYAAGRDAGAIANRELASRWTGQRRLDDTVAAIAAGRDAEAVSLASTFADRSSVFAGLVARMMKTGREPLLNFAAAAMERDASAGERRFGGRPLLHLACAAGCLPAVEAILRNGTDPNLADRGGHTALYAVANECERSSGPEIVRALVRAGADVNAQGGHMKSTPLHMAARRGFVGIVQALIECGAAADARDRNGVTPLRRALACRRRDVAELLRAL